MRRIAPVVLILLTLCIMQAPIAFSKSPAMRIGSVSAKEVTVIFNTKTKKFHSPECRWAIRCTRNCISLSKSEAIRRGGVPCKICGGGVKRDVR